MDTFKKTIKPMMARRPLRGSGAYRAVSEHFEQRNNEASAASAAY